MAAWGVAFAGLVMLGELMGRGTPLLLFPFAVLVAAGVGGLGPGLVATGLGIAATAWFYAGLSSDLGPRLLFIGGFAAQGAGITTFAWLLQRQRRAAIEEALGRHRAEIEADNLTRQSESQLRQMASTMPQIVWITRPDGYHEYFNQRWHEYTGLTLSESLGHNWVRPLHPLDRARSRRRWQRALATGEPYEIEYRFRRGADGEHRWFLGRALPVRDDSGRIVRWFGTCTDIHDLKQAQDAAEQANRVKDEFLATLSHELRTPLNAILGWAQVLRTPEAGRDDFEQGLEVIERNARVQTQLIEDLLDVSRIISGKLRLQTSSVNMPEVIRAAVEVVRPAAEAKRLRIVCDLDEECPPIRGDVARLQQVAWNLLSNAVKFTPPEGRIEVTLSREEGALRFVVTDSGEGIDPAFLPQMFQRFSQSDGTSTRRHGGLGLGLSIVRQLVELHGGAVQAASPGPGRGASFGVTLPLIGAGTAPHSEHSHRDNPDAHTWARSHRLQGHRVLVVDDDPDARRLLGRVLQGYGADVTTASGAREALGLLSHRRFDVLVSDIAMPEQDGYDLIRNLRGSSDMPRKLPAVAVTAFAREEDRRRALSAGFQEHLAKPVDPGTLADTIVRLTQEQ